MPEKLDYDKRQFRTVMRIFPLEKGTATPSVFLGLQANGTSEKEGTD